MPVICADCEAVYFCGQDWTASIRLIQLCKFGPARTPRASLSMPAAILSVACVQKASPAIRIKFGAHYLLEETAFTIGWQGVTVAQWHKQRIASEMT